MNACAYAAFYHQEVATSQSIGQYKTPAQKHAAFIAARNAVLAGAKTLHSFAKRYPSLASFVRLRASFANQDKSSISQDKMLASLPDAIPGIGCSNFLHRFHHGGLLFQEPFDTLGAHNLVKTPIMLAFHLDFILSRWKLTESDYFEFQKAHPNDEMQYLRTRLGFWNGERMPDCSFENKYLIISQIVCHWVQFLKDGKKWYLKEFMHEEDKFDASNLERSIQRLIKRGVEIIEWNFSR
jgi:hypothetical protein